MNKEEIVYLKVKDLKNNPKNPRKNDNAVESVAKSIEKYGFRNPLIVDENNIVWCGNTRLKASKKLGLKEVPCIVVRDLTEKQITELAILDNKTNEIAEWDFDLLEEILPNLGLDEFELDWGVDEFLEEQKEVEEDNYEVPDEIEPRVKLGEIWKLGEHRLMCGDSTKEEDVEKLMNGNNIDMIFTDPPYNINYSGVKDKRTIQNDKMQNEEFVEFLVKSLIKTSTAYVCCSWQYCDLFRKAMELKGMKPKAMIIWNKINPAQNLDKYFKQHEIIWYYGKFGGEKTIRGDIWECKRQKNTLHPTMKPIELISMAIKDNPLAKNIYDAFGGSGSTLIACEQLNRKCYIMELDEKYATVIIDRWEKLTGKKAVKIS